MTKSLPKNKNFWTTLPRPFFCLAPMADVTDPAFRTVIAKYGQPDVMWTEFVSADGLCSDLGRPKLLPTLRYTEGERPIVAQIFGSTPDNFYTAAQLLVTLGFDGIDINMGCPEKSISGKQGAGAGLIKQPKLAQEIIAATKAGGGGLPVSVKTRLGFSKNEIDTWLPALLAAQPAAITVHGRTRKEMSKVPARWEAIRQAVEIARGSGVLIIGNGDVRDLTDARQRVAEYGVDGVMLGRAIFGNPWLFDRERSIADVPLAERLAVMVEHARIYDELMSGIKPFELMKKHFKAYVSGFAGAAELRAKLMTTTNASEVAAVITQYGSQ
ncbi:MAG: tRNA-dihydrouridine synthase [Patescibacteria group bacterium]